MSAGHRADPEVQEIKTMAQGIRSKLAKFLRGETGNVAIVTAIALVPLMMAGGAAVACARW